MFTNHGAPEYKAEKKKKMVPSFIVVQNLVISKQVSSKPNCDT